MFLCMYHGGLAGRLDYVGLLSVDQVMNECTPISFTDQYIELVTALNYKKHHHSLCVYDTQQLPTVHVYHIWYNYLKSSIIPYMVIWYIYTYK